VVKKLQCSTLVQSDMIGFVALDFVLWIILARVVDVASVIQVLGVNTRDAAANPASLRVPAQVITDFECFSHSCHSGLAAARAAQTSTFHR
jgi:hypothetical protein